MISQNPDSPSARRPEQGAIERALTSSRLPANTRRSTRRNPASSEAESLINPWAVLNALRRRWLPATLVAIPAALIAAAACWKAIPSTYTSFAMLRIASTEPRLVFDTAERKSDFDTYRQTQAAMITSRFVLNAALRKPGVSDLETIRQQAYPIAWLETQLEVGTNRSPEILRISMKGERPDDIAAIVNAVKDAYLEEVVHAERKDRLARLSDLERIFSETDEKVRLKQERVEKLAKQLGTGDSKALTIKQQMALEYFAQLQREHARVRFELMREQLESATGNASPAETSSIDIPLNDAIKSAPNDPTGDPTRQLLARRILQQRDLIARFEKQVVDRNHPSIAEHRHKLKEMESQLALMADGPVVTDPATGRPVPNRNRRLTRRETLEKQEEMLREELERYSELATTIGTSSFELEAMQTELTQVTKIADRIGGEIEALRIELQSPPRVVLLQAAEVPQKRDLGRKTKMTAMAGFGTLGLILAAFVLLDLRSRRVATADDVTEELSLPLLGTLPPLPNASRNGAALDLAHRRWQNSVAEATDGVRSLLLRDDGNAPAVKTILVASAASGEGKTSVACELARSLARAGRRTLLIDFDLRRPGVHEAFGLDNARGVVDVLTRGTAWREVARPTDEYRLTILPAGPGGTAALPALARGEASRLIESVKPEFDAIVLDTPPLLVVSDAAAIGRQADGAILVMRRDVSRSPYVSAARDRLATLGIPLFGAVLVGARSELQASVYEYQERSREPELETATK